MLSSLTYKESPEAERLGRAPLTPRWQRVCPAVQETRSPNREEPTCAEQLGPEATAVSLCSGAGSALTARRHLRSEPAPGGLCSHPESPLRKSPCRSGDSAQPEIKVRIKLRLERDQPKKI